jgi:hypothetical protein
MGAMQRKDESGPSREEVLKFLQVVDRLCNFEAEHRQLRSWGIFNNETLPIPEVVTAIEWLNKKFNITSEEIQSWRERGNV